MIVRGTWAAKQMGPDRKSSGGRKANRQPKVGTGGSKVSSGKGIGKPSGKRRTAREAPLQQAVVKYLRQRKRYVGDVQFCHVPNEVRKGGGRSVDVRNEIARKKAEGLTPGAPDLVVWLDRKRQPAAEPGVIAIEIKYGSTAQSENQKQFEGDLDRLDHDYFLVRAAEPSEASAKVHALIEAFQPMETVPFGMLAWVAEDDPRIERGPTGSPRLGKPDPLAMHPDHPARRRGKSRVAKVAQATQD